MENVLWTGTEVMKRLGINAYTLAHHVSEEKLPARHAYDLKPVAFVKEVPYVRVENKRIVERVMVPLSDKKIADQRERCRRSVASDPDSFVFRPEDVEAFIEAQRDNHHNSPAPKEPPTWAPKARAYALPKKKKGLSIPGIANMALRNGEDWTYQEDGEQYKQETLEKKLRLILKQKA